MKIKLFAGLALAAVMAGPAMAADMPLKAPPPAPVPYFTWTGLYVGGFVGSLHTKTDNAFVFPPPATLNQSSNNAFGGGFIGAQWQYQRIVLGAEADIGTAFGRSFGSAPCNPATACVAGTTLNQTQTSNSGLLTAGGRLGLAFDRWLPYVSGGYATISESEAFFFPGAVETANLQREGAYIGGGIDWAIPMFSGWVAGAEYRHYSFRNETFVPITAGGAFDPFNSVISSQRLDTIVFRLSYLFSPK